MYNDAKIVQTECNQACLNCLGAANLMQRLCKANAEHQVLLECYAEP